MSVIVNESNISKQLSEFWNLENLGIEAEVSDEENIDNDIMSEFEAGISYQNKRYKVKFLWKPNMKTLLENNEEVARKRFLKLRSRFKNDSSLFEDYKLVVNNYLSEKIVERVPFEEENLKNNIFYRPHRASLYVDDFLCGNVSVQAALTTCIESKQDLEDPSMDLRKWRTNSSELNQRERIKGARNILNEWNEICKSNRIQLFSAEEGIEWNFIPPASPHFGGLWEANIKSMKRILLRVAKSAIMNFEELTTLMAQIKAVLNSRPLSPLSSDPNDLNPLTPGHFLTNCAIPSFPEPYTASDSFVLSFQVETRSISERQILEPLSTEYLTHLQTCAKWSEQNPQPDGESARSFKGSQHQAPDWPMGRILEVFPGSDGLCEE
ncbi:integrase catalytic domain-containing protein [Trichonephila clavipes]|nr:integrase catalytic domain-containing protein [Trichonephila clavipes]